MLCSQNMPTQQDSLRAVSILMKAHIKDTNEPVSLNPNGLQLNLCEKEAIKVIEIVLFSAYGKSQIRKQNPFNIIKVGKYWVVYGSIKPNRYGGVFEIVLNSENSCVEYLSHGK